MKNKTPGHTRKAGRHRKEVKSKMSGRKKCALGLSSLTPESKVTHTQTILNSMQGSGYFPNSQMPVSYTNLQALIDNLNNAVLASDAGTISSQAMHEQEKILVTAFNLVKAHVEYVANASATPETIITSAGFAVSVTGGQNAVTELTLDATGNGAIQVRVPRASDEKAFVYEKSTDGTTYTKVIACSLSKITITGQTPGSTIYVRYWSITKNGEGAVSQPKTIMVI